MENARALQTRLYFILEKLKLMTAAVPEKYQQRIPTETLSGLANSLLHDTVFQIVRGLKEIQDVTERQLFQARQQLKETHRVEREKFISKYSKSSTFTHRKAKFESKLESELKAFDKGIIAQYDAKLREQQMMLEKAGVPGFYPTTNPSEIKIQMFLLDFILRLGEMELPQIPEECWNDATME